jgi:hypothetical protein
MKPSICVVLGMHRSGTSAVTRGLSTLGISLGTNLLPAAANNNETGFWEDKDIYAFNEQLLATIDEKWSSVRLYDNCLRAIPELPALYARARDLLASKIGSNDLFGFKDPRTSRLLIFWINVFELLSLTPKYVVVTRNPLSVAQSLLKRDGLRESQSYLLWLQHMLAALRWTENSLRIVVDYDQLLSTPTRQLDRIRSALNLAKRPDSTDLLAEYVSGFLREDLRHTHYGSAALSHVPEVPPSVTRLQRLLTALADDELTPNDSKCKREIRQIWRSMNDFSTVFSLAETVLTEERSLKNALHEKNLELEEREVGLTGLSARVSNLEAELQGRDALNQELSRELELQQHRLVELETLVEKKQSCVEILEARLILEGEQRTHLEAMLAEINESIREMGTNLAAQARRFPQLEESLRQRDTFIQKLTDEILLRDCKLESIGGELTAWARRAQHVSNQMEVREQQLRDLRDERDSQRVYSSDLERQLTVERARSQYLAKSTEALEQAAEYERKRGEHAEQLHESTKAAAEVAESRVERLSQHARELGAHYRESLFRLELIENGAFSRFTRPIRVFWEYVERRLLRRNVLFRMIPNDQVEVQPRDHAWRSTGDDPHFELVPVHGYYPHGWVLVATTVRSAVRCGGLKLYADYGQGTSEASAVHVHATRQGRVRQVVYFPSQPRRLRWDPIDAPGELIQGPISISEIGALERLLRMAARVSNVLRDYPDDVLRSRKLSLRRVLTDLPRAYLEASELLDASPLRPTRG